MTEFHVRLKELRKHRKKKLKETRRLAWHQLVLCSYESGTGNLILPGSSRWRIFLTCPWIICWGVLTRTQICDILL